jgi:hypothetical protein
MHDSVVVGSEKQELLDKMTTYKEITQKVT